MSRRRKKLANLPLAALALVPSAACDAQAVDFLVHEKVSVPFDGMRAHRNPMTPYLELIERLKRQAAAEARDARYTPVVSIRPAGATGERTVVAAITPRRGVFYYAETGPYGSGPVAIIVPRREVELCRFTVNWDDLPGGPHVPGIIWAQLPFPDLSCNRPAGEPLAAAREWRRQSANASYSVAVRGSEAGLRGSVVREAWPGQRFRPNQPSDGGRAAAALAGGNDRVVRAIPVNGDHSFFVETASGRSFVGMYPSQSGGGETMCLVEGLRWQDLASSDRRRMTAAEGLC